MNDREYIAYCGLDCQKCEARIATALDDDGMRRKVARKWSELNSTEITPEMINCTGCRLAGAKTPFCESLCPIRKCAADRKLETCGACPDMDACSKLRMITENNPEAEHRLRQFCGS